MTEPLLTRALAAQLTNRVPPGLIRVAVVAGVLGASTVGYVTTGTTPFTAEIVSSSSWVLSSALQSLALASLALVVTAPRAGLVLATVSLGVGGLLPTIHQGLPAAWLVPAAALAVIAVTEGVLSVRRRALAPVLLGADPTSVTIPELPSYVVAPLLVRSLEATVGSIVLMLVAAGAVGWWWHDDSAASDFRAQAVVADATVVSVADDHMSAEVELDGETLRMPTTNLDRTVGDRVTVRWSPETGRVEAVDDVMDPTLVLIVAAFAGVLGVGWVLRSRRTRRGLFDLLTRPQPALTCLATWTPRRHGVLILAVDDAGRPVATAPRLVQVLAAPQHDPQGGPVGPSYGHAPPAPAETWHGETVLVAGRIGEAGPVLITHGEDVFVATAPLRFPAWRSLRPRTDIATERPSLYAEFKRSRDAVIEQVGRTAGRWLPWILLPGAWFASSWVVSVTGPSPRLIGAGLTFAGLAWAVSFLGHSTLNLRPRALVFRGLLLDTMIPWARVTAAEARDEVLTVGYDDGKPGGGRLVITVTPKSRPVVRDGAPPAEVAGRIEVARAERALARGRVRLRPSASTVLGACWVAALLVPLLRA
ncbi:MAG: hypothetical protein KQH57_07705 [Actinomycetales bacterium]|nr:hypothetical protein [Actinomycetales bacterium]